MRAVVLREPERLELIDIPEPQLTKENHVLVRVEACGICGSDLRYWSGENPWALHTLGRHVPNPADLVLGHELAGVVVRVHSPRWEHLVGKRVGVQAFRVCGECALCRSGHENLCKNTVHIGHAQGWDDMPYYPGGYAEYCLAWADLLHLMPDHVSFEEEAMRDILGVAVHAVGRAEIRPGMSVLCIGGGPAGLCMAQVARARGCGHVVISDPSPLARRIVAQYDVFTAVDPSRESVSQVLQKTTGGERFGAVFDSVGTAETTEEALSLLEATGTYVSVAVHDTPLSFSALALGSERAMTTSSNAYYRDEREAHDMIGARSVDVRPMITHRFPLDQFQEAFDLLLRVPKEAYKVVLKAWQ